METFLTVSKLPAAEVRVQKSVAESWGNPTFPSPLTPSHFSPTGQGLYDEAVNNARASIPLVPAPEAMAPHLEK